MTAPELELRPEDFTVHAQWGPRPSSIEDTGRLLAGVLALTADAEPRITVWFPTDTDSWGFSLTGLSRFPDPMITMAKELADGDPPVVRVELETSDVERTGAPLSGLDIVIGSVDRYDPNHITWALREAGNRFLSSPAGAISVLRAMIAMTDCDWAAISSSAIDRLQPANPDGPTAGWATYISHRLLPHGVTSLPGIVAEPVHRGYLLMLAARPEQTTKESVLTLTTALQ